MASLMLGRGEGVFISERVLVHFSLHFCLFAGGDGENTGDHFFELGTAQIGFEGAVLSTAVFAQIDQV